MNLEEQELFGFHPPLQPIPVPAALDQRIAETIKRASARRRRKRSLRRGALLTGAAAAAAIVLIVVSPPVASFAKSIPGLQPFVQQLEKWGPYSGISVAKSHGYIPIEPLTVSREGITVTIDNVYFEENRLLYTATVRSEAIAQYWQTAHGGFDEGGIGVDVTSVDFEQNPGNLSSAPAEDADTGERTYHIKGSYTLSQAEYDAFMGGQHTYFTFNLRQFKVGDTDPSTRKEFQFKVPFQAAHIQAAKKIQIRSGLKFEDHDSDIAASMLDDLMISPTQMRLSISSSLQASERMPFFVASGLDQETAGGVNFTSLVSQRERPYLTDGNGNRYDMLNTGRDFTSSSRELDFTPSVYFDKNAKLQLHISKVWVTGPVAESIDVSLTDTFPKTISYRGKPLTLLHAKYEKGYLLLMIKREEENLPFYYESGFSDEDLNRISGGTLLMMSDYWKQVQTSDSGSSLYQQYMKEADFGLLGLYVPNLTSKTPGKEQYEIRVPAPEQQTYHLDVIRYNDPVEVNLTVPIKLD